MPHHSFRHLHFGLLATTLAGAFGCNSHALAELNPNVVIVDMPPDVQPPPPPVEPGLRDAGQEAPLVLPPATVEPRPDGAIPDTAVVVGGPDTAANPDIGRDSGRDMGPDSSRDAGREAVPDTGN